MYSKIQIFFHFATGRGYFFLFVLFVVVENEYQDDDD